MFSAVAVILFQDWLHSGGPIHWASVYSPEISWNYKGCGETSRKFHCVEFRRQVCTILVESFSFLILLSFGIPCHEVCCWGTNTYYSIVFTSKRWCICIKRHGVTFQTTIIFVVYRRENRELYLYHFPMWENNSSSMVHCYGRLREYNVFRPIALMPATWQYMLNFAGATWPRKASFSGEKLRKATVNFVMSVCPSVRPPARMEQLGSHWTDFHEISYLSIFENLSRKWKFC